MLYYTEKIDFSAAAEIVSSKYHSFVHGLSRYQRYTVCASDLVFGGCSEDVRR